jgi:hypothetical protein
MTRREKIVRLVWLVSLCIGWVGAPFAYQAVLKAKNFELLRGGGELIAAVGLSGIIVSVINAVAVLLVRAVCKVAAPSWERSPIYAGFSVVGFLGPAASALVMLAIEGLPYGSWGNAPV